MKQLIPHFQWNNIEEINYLGDKFILFKNIKDLYNFFPKIQANENISPFEEEIFDFLFKKLIATYIPNILPSSHPLELQKYFINKVFDRTGLKLDNKDPFINKLVVYSLDYHNKQRKSSHFSPTKFCNLCKMSFSNGHIGLPSGVMDILNPGTYFSNTTKQEDPKMDHISPISKFGNNDLENFQTLCFVCNSGKSNICSQYDKYNLFNERVKIEHLEKFKKDEYIAIENDKKPFNFLSNSLYTRVILRDKSCYFCHGKQNSSLTMMPLDRDTLYTYDNLITICYDCLNTYDTIKDIRFL
ncbi:HNH endonuclease [Bacillus cereus]|uniref:HNH endonuclease n=1 Tax=Bacillus cereus TaxID=1396 RepID=UPI0015CF5E5A|nr:HNH endonuclease signature motif containing protein [Bacillus cereus]